MKAVSVEQIDPHESDPGDEWIAYPASKTPRLSSMSQYFEEACQLSFIARDISRELPKVQDAGTNASDIKQGLYDRLFQWERKLPRTFDSAERPAPHILLLR